MNVALITVDEDFEAFGLRSISSILKQSGHRTRLILLKYAKPVFSDRVLEQIDEMVSDCGLVGIGCFSRASGKAVQVIRHLRGFGHFCAWGGVYATLNSEACADQADVVCRGEGEGFIVELADRLEKGENWTNLANAVYRKNDQIVVNGPRPLIEDLDALPMMDFSFDAEYRLKGEKIVSARPPSGGSVPISFNGTRGCDFQCTYCSNSRLKEMSCGSGRYARRLGISRLVEQAESLRNTFPGARCFEFFDEDFCARSADELRQFSEEYPPRVGLPFTCMVSPPRTSEEKMKLLVKAGLWRIHMGIESGSERTKTEVYDRRMSNDTVLRAARAINRHPHVVPYYFFIIGNPYENRDDLTATARFIGRLPHPWFLRTYNLVFFPGTLLYESAVRDGIIRGEQDSGRELDFVGGLDHRRHAWKKKNLYLNGLLYLMSGKVTSRRLGFVPRAWLDPLLKPGVIAFNERRTALIRLLISLKTHAFRLRGHAAVLVKTFFNNPFAIYHFGRLPVSESGKEKRGLPARDDEAE